MASLGTRITVTTTATKLNGTDTNRISGSSLVIRNKGEVSIFLGNTDVLSSTGFELEVGESITLDLSTGDNIYAITASGTCVCHILALGV